MKIAFAVMLIFVSCCGADAKGWQGIVPLHSDRADVEKLLGAPAIMRHVLQRRAVPPKRIKLIEGGYRAKPEIELYLLTEGLSAPEPRATWTPCR